MKLKAIRTDLETDKTRLVEIELKCAFCPRPVIYVTQGCVTGFEAMHIESIVTIDYNGWLACAGLPGQWDRLRIPRTELKRFRKTVVKEIQIVVDALTDWYRNLIENYLAH